MAVAGTVAAGGLAGCMHEGGDTDGDGDGGADGDGTDGDGAMDGDGTGSPPDGDGDTNLEVREHPEHGSILVDGDGMTLYVFTQDEEGESVCYDQCAEAWPPLTVDGEVNAPSELQESVGTTERDDGSTQVTYDGSPLYYYQGDEEPGDASGQGLNDAWFVVEVESGGEQPA